MYFASAQIFECVSAAWEVDILQVTLKAILH